MSKPLFWRFALTVRAAECNVGNPVSSVQCRLIPGESKPQHQTRLESVSTGNLLKTQTPRALVRPPKE